MITCDSCGKECKTMQGLRGHEQLQHQGVVADSGASNGVNGQAAQNPAASQAVSPELRSMLAGVDDTMTQVLERTDQARSEASQRAEDDDQVSEDLGSLHEELDELGEGFRVLKSVVAAMSKEIGRIYREDHGPGYFGEGWSRETVIDLEDDDE